MAQYSKQITPLIIKYNIDVDKNQTFNKIIEMFDGQTPYQIWAIKLVFDKKIPIQHIEAFREFANNNQTMIQKLAKKNLVSYTTKEDIKYLQNEIIGLLRIDLLNNNINTFNTAQRKLLRDLIFSGSEPSPIEAFNSEKIKKYYDIFKKFSLISKSRKHNIITTASALNSTQTLMKHIMDGLNKTYDWNKEDLLGFIATNDDCENVKVTYNKDNIVILEIPTFNASHTLCHGRTSWCITRTSDYFNSYVLSKTGNRQFFYFDFSKPEKDELAHIGFTVSPKHGIVNAHSTGNSDIRNRFSYNGVETNINKILDSKGISQKLFIHLNGIKGFAWTIESILAFVENLKDVSICYNKNGRLIFRILSKKSFNQLFGNTLVSSESLSFDEKNNGLVYGLIDTNFKPNDDNSMIVMQMSKDEYGYIECKYSYNAFGSDITNERYLSTKLNILSSEFINQEKINSSILLHKYIDEKNTNDAVNLINAKPNDLDINYLFNSSAPIYKTIDNNLYDVFSAIINCDKFDSSVTDSIGEPILQSLIYEYIDKVNCHESTESLTKMIQIILDSKTYDFNAQNINLDTAINVAAGSQHTNWIVESLVSRPNVNVNVVNDVNCAAFGEAIRHGNIDGAKILLRRNDVNITDYDKQLMKEKSINLNQLMPKDDERIKIESDSMEKLKNISDKLVEAFANALSMSK